MPGLTTRTRIGLLAAALVSVLLLSLGGGDSIQAGGPRTLRAEDCRECHADQYEGWMLSSHRLTLYDRTFQAAWERVKRSTECLTCHTTNFEAEAGPDYWGVTCMACHTRAADQTTDALEREHEVRTVPQDSAACATCHEGDHTVTYAEWVVSDHNGPRAVQCQDCHDPHSGHLAAESVTALCDTCHLQPLPTEAPYMHYEGVCTECHAHQIAVDNVHMRGGTDAPSECSDCHMRTERDFKGYLVSGGHALTVGLDSCVDCHGTLHSMQPG